MKALDHYIKRAIVDVYLKLDIGIKVPKVSLPFALIGLLIFFNYSSAAQTVTILNESTLKPVEDVSVYSASKKFSDLSDEMGKIELKNVKGSDTLIFQHPAYYKLSVPVGNLKNLDHTVYLTDRIYFITSQVVSPRKSKEKVSEIIRSVDIIPAKDIAFSNPQTTADMLRHQGNIFIQKSQMGGGSPVIRGFEANKVLIVIDGVRMNNAIYRSGHLQNVITIDNTILDRAEIILGPGSVIYGSDAMGGVMHFYTKKPKLSTTDKTNTKTNYFTRFSSANFERTAHLDLNFGKKKIGWLTSVTYSKFNDLTTGHSYHPDYPDFGKSLYYVKRFGTKDSMVANEDVAVQKFTGYSQIDLVQKIRYRPNDRIDYLLNLQYSTSSNVPRFDRLNDTLNGKLKYAEWYYGPQTRLLAALDITLSPKNNSFLTNGNIIAAYQKIDEDRISRRFNNLDELHKEEDVYVMSLNADFFKLLKKKHKISYGFETIYNLVRSGGYKENISTLANSPTASRYPDKSNMRSYEGYLLHKWYISKKVILTEGIRFSKIFLNANFVDTFYNFPFQFIEINTSALSGSIGLLLSPGKDMHIRVSGGSSFRAPNVDDVGKIFDSSPGNVIVPNNSLKPEYSYSGELTIDKGINGFVRVSTTVFYSYIVNVMVRRDFQLNGQDSILYEGVMSRVQANVNQNEAYINGVNFRILADLNKRISIKSSINYTFSEDISEGVPLGHIPPTYGQSDIIYHYKKLKGTFFITYNGWKRIADYSPFNEDKSDEATPDGTPSWYTMNTTFSYQINKFICLQAGLENILDLHYKVFASGLSSSGRNFIFGVRGSF